jgi:gluconokinase
VAEYFIGIDIGTGSTKALAVNLKGQVLFTSQESYSTMHPHEGYCEQSPGLLWQAFLTCVTRITRELKNSPSGISISCAMHSLISVDENGIPLTDIITWADNRSSEIAKRIYDSSAGEMLYEQTGTPIHPMSPLCKIIWLKENYKTVFDTTHKFISIKEFIWHKLFNAYEVDHSIASATGLMDIEKFEWNKNSLELCSISSTQLSQLVSTDYFRSDADPLQCLTMGVTATTPFFIGASDGCCANIGSFATEPGVAALTIGTSGAIRVCSKNPVYNFEAMTFNYRVDKNLFVCGGPTNNGGVVLKWYAQNFLQKKLENASDYNDLLNGVEKIPPGADGLIFLPYILGERAPIWNSEACGVFFGIRQDHTQAHFTRAVIEGISLALFDIANHMIAGGLDISQVHVSGGFVHSTPWLQILANIFNKKICLVYAEDASAIGAAYIAMKKMNIISSYKNLEPTAVKEIIPQAEHVTMYNEKHILYRDLYKNLKPLMK